MTPTDDREGDALVGQRDNDRSDDDSVEDSDGDSSDEDGEDDALSLADPPSSLLRQHAAAILAALIATAASYHGINGALPGGSYPATFLPSFGGSKYKRRGVGGTDGHLHNRLYRRTAGLTFCPLGDGGGGDGEEAAVDRRLEAFDFHVPLDLVGAIGAHYLADEMVDAGEGPSEGLETGGGKGEDPSDPEYRCLAESAAALTSSGSRRRHVSGTSLAYIQPEVRAMYPEDHPTMTERRAAGKSLDPSSLSFTGFAAKFYNLSPKTLNLWWDGASGKNLGERLVGEVQPYESIGTATTPGQSFSFSAVYDRDHVVGRWTVTSDEAVIAYDPYRGDQSKGNGRTEEENEAALGRELTPEQRGLYEAQLLNLAYGRDYLIKTGRPWLGMFPRPRPHHRMWDAEYLGKKHKVTTRQTRFVSMPPEKELVGLTFGDYMSIAESGNDVSLKKYREGGTLNLTLEVVSCAPQVFKIDNFLSKVETRHFLNLVKSGQYNITMEESTVHPGGMRNNVVREDGGEEEEEAEASNAGAKSVRGAQRDPSTRSSSNAWVDREVSPVVDTIYRRAADLMRIDEALLRNRDDDERTDFATHHSVAEPMQLLRYREGEQYTPHHDFLYPSSSNRLQPSRFATMLLYLNDDDLEGGETVFPRAVNAELHDGIEVEPRAGTAILFYNVLPDGNLDDLSQHASRAVVRGEKWLANLWIWDPLID